MNSPTSIVVLDGHTLNPGDLSWGHLGQLGPCVVHARTPATEIIPRAKEATILLTNKTPLTKATLGALPRLRFIGVLATGYNVVDVVAARSRGIPVSNVPAYGTHSVAQHVFSLLMELTGRTAHHAKTVRDGRWTANPDWCFWDGQLIELSGLMLGVIGAGRIGHAVGAIGEAFGMTVQYATSSGGLPQLETVLRTSDVVSLHCPLTDATREFINATTLAWMKPTALLINTSRGALVEEAALAEALNSGVIAGAGLDVLSTEPPSGANPLLSARNCVVTPHLAWATYSARRRLMDVAAENVSAFLTGQPQNVVN